MKETWGKMNLTTPIRFVKIGIIDSGLDASGERHPEFRGVDLGNTPNDAKVDTEPSDIPGATAGHGTQIAGIIGANNISASGVDFYEHPQMNGILSGVKNLNYTLEIRRPTFASVFTTDAWSVFAEINKLESEGVDIINISSGSPYLPGIHDIWYIPTFTMLNKTLFVVSAGNDDRSAELQIPANYGDNFNNVITVGSTIFDDTRLSYGNYGSAVSISAPGLGLYSPSPRGKGDYPTEVPGIKNYDTNFSGTSASAPLVTGVAGLLKAIKPSLTPAQIKQILIRTADPIQTGETDKRLGVGCYLNPNDTLKTGCRLNAYRAVCDSEVGLNCAPSVIAVSDATTMVGTSPAVPLSFIHPSWSADLDGGHDPLRNDGTFDGSKWIWATDGPTDPTVAEIFTFEKTFTVNNPVSTSTLYFAVDDSATVRLNGNNIPVSSGNSYSASTEGVYVVPASNFVLGQNVLSVTATNYAGGYDPQANPAGILFKLVEGTPASEAFSASAKSLMSNVGALTVSTDLSGE